MASHRAAKSHEEQITALMERGRAAAEAGQRDRAQRYFAAVIEIDPSYVEAWLERAAVVEDPQEAMAHLAQVLMLNPGNERARQELRSLRQSAGNLPPYQGTLPAAATFAPRQEALSQSTGTTTFAWVFLAALFLLLLVGGALWFDAPQTVVAALLPTDTPTPTATFRPTLTPTSTPTSTPSPTPTHTQTPAPTSTPTSTSTQTSTPTATATHTPTFTPTPRASKVPADKSESGKWIEVDLSKQRLCAHDGQETVFCAPVSTGTSRYPTVRGRFKIYAKYRTTRMSGPGYNLPNVPWTMYFHGSYAIHGAYWHNNFGTPMSHGCVNMKTAQARRLFQWAPKKTLVVVHR